LKENRTTKDSVNPKQSGGKGGRTCREGIKRFLREKGRRQKERVVRGNSSTTIKNGGELEEELNFRP